MNIIWQAVAEFSKTHSIEETDVLARKLLGLDTSVLSYIKDSKPVSIKQRKRRSPIRKSEKRAE